MQLYVAKALEAFKLVFLHEDRFVEFHNQGGKYYRMRVPRFGRDLCYNRLNCDLIVVGNSSDIYRINLEQGRFLSPYTSARASGFNTCVINDYHQLLAVGSQEGTVECWDPRTRKSVGNLNAACFVDSNSSKLSPETTCLRYNGGLSLAVGTSTGQVMLFDIRSNKPTLVKDHHYEFPIHSIQFLTDTDENRLVLSCDKKGVKAWHQESGDLVTAIEPSDCEINHMQLYPSSGLVFLAAETQKIHAYFVPTLGPAPKWCSFLENLTEEMEEERSNVVYDDFKFVTRSELDSIGLTHLIGTSKLRAYMHGYFVNVQLYSRAKQESEPFAFEQFKQKKIKEDMDRERHDRVQLEKLPSVNRETAVRLKIEKQRGKAKSKREAEALLTDERFAPKLFGDADMQMDLDKEDVDTMNPSTLARMVALQPAIQQATQLMRREEQQIHRRQKNEAGEDKDDENVHIEASKSDLSSNEEEAASSDSDEGNEVKHLKKLVRTSAKANKLKSSDSKQQSKSKAPPVSRLEPMGGESPPDSRDEQQRNSKVEMVVGSSVAERDFVVPVRSKLSLKNFNAESSALSERLEDNETFSKQVDIGINRSQSASFQVATKPKVDKKGKKRSRRG
ncbi:nucleolar protein 10-like isoform X2 [Symsagittifera roscoffensis]|uniref:nucleolar protein 10-like isoform X2 n=1 Tax=Symsagittifera roscoffensis TaxID=84072 RepID=UPI00307BC359